MPVAASGQNWPAFRGGDANAVFEHGSLRSSWNADPASGQVAGVRWRVAVPGLGHSSPILWGDRIYLSTAVASGRQPTVKVGATGEPTAAEDNYTQSWLILCYDRITGKEVWRRTATEGKPRATRHVKATQVNTTLSADGDRIVAFFGSEGLYCYDMQGKLLWSRDLGVINVSKYGIGWGFASSPAVRDNRVALLCDAPDNPFLAVFRLSDGKELWRVSRKGLCERSWGTPLIHAGGNSTQVVANGWPWIISYDMETGKELWRLRGGGDNPAPTPFVAHGWIFVTNAHGGKSPIYAIRPDARGDITPGGKSGDAIVWSAEQGGSYISTPVVYREHIYFGNTNGVLRCFEWRTGNKVYEERLGPDAAIYASLVAGDEKIYCPSEDGVVYVVQAGGECKVLARNPLGEPCFATPAISSGTLYFRTTMSLMAVA